MFVPHFQLQVPNAGTTCTAAALPEATACIKPVWPLLTLVVVSQPALISAAMDSGSPSGHGALATVHAHDLRPGQHTRGRGSRDQGLGASGEGRACAGTAFLAACHKGDPESLTTLGKALMFSLAHAANRRACMYRGRSILHAALGCAGTRVVRRRHIHVHEHARSGQRYAANPSSEHTQLEYGACV